MRAWPATDVPPLPVAGPPVRVHDSSSGRLVETRPDGPARLYVCGITPYDATHLGHANTYLAFDLLNRAWRSAGHEVRYVQNVTDVDDPLLERARQTGEDWTAVAERETELFRTDMAALRVLPPDHYVGAVESIPLVIELIEALQAAGAIYAVDEDLYFAVDSDAGFGQVSGWDREAMVATFGERGGDPDRPGKRDPLDCLVWMAQRPGEPAWPSPFGTGRPGWHIECTAIAERHLGEAFDVQGGGSDLVFPHHEMCAAEGQVARPGSPFAAAYVHAGMVAYEGEKMSKSRGNLVFVSRLRAAGVDPMALRLALLAQHYRADWEWTDDLLDVGTARLDRWRAAVAAGVGADATSTVEGVLTALATDLDAPAALALVDAWAAASVAGDTSGGAAAVDRIRTLTDAALGVLL